jgi:hypothetical protein
MGTDGSDEITADLETFVAERFFEALASRPRRETLGLYDPTGAGQDATW